MKMITSANLMLEPLSMRHVESLWPHMSNLEITDFLAWDAHTDINQTETVVQSLIRGQEEGKGVHWIILQGNELVGLVSIIDLRRKHLSWTLNRGEVAFWVAPEYWGKGIATAASRLVLDYAFGEFGLHKMLIAHASDNLGSERVIKKLGFKYVGEFVEAFSKNGIWHNLKFYEWLGRDWLLYRHNRNQG